MSNATKWLLIALVVSFIGHHIWCSLGFNETRVEVDNKGTRYFMGPEAKKRNDIDEKLMDERDAQESEQ